MLLIKKLVPLSIFHQSRMKFTKFVGIGKIKLRSRWESQNSLIEAIQTIDEDNFHIQIFNSENIISSKHLYYAVYFAEQAFALSSNISKSISIEYLIYASLQRQIKTAINSVGFLIEEGVHPEYASLVITAPTEQEVNAKYSKVMKVLNATPLEDEVIPLEQSRIHYLQNHFQISDFELRNALLCEGSRSTSTFKEQNEDTKLQVLLHVITEKMAQLLMENFKHSN